MPQTPDPTAAPNRDDPIGGPRLADAGLRLKNLAASAAVVFVACLAYGLLPQHRDQLARLYGGPALSFTGREFLAAAAAAYVLVLGLFHTCERRPAVSKSLRCWQLLAAFVRDPRAMWRRGVSGDDRLALLATLLKAFFGPLMMMSLMGFCMGALANGAAILASGAFDAGFRTIFDRHGFWFLMQLFLFVDVAVFTLGYLIELPRLGNRIRSVDPTLLGWVAALACYPPFNHLTGAVLGSQVSDFPQFDDPGVHLAMNASLLTLMGAYAWTSLALGFKASNLTHRGIVSRGPYALVRHPAYVCKNLAWWIASVPLVSAAFGTSLLDGVIAVGSVVAWTLLYVMRALTEEDHLRSVDGDYAAYAARVPRRFIPGLV
jgi:protein-S-isoprenylcysteine O-methyltransferase Ste14